MRSRCRRPLARLAPALLIALAFAPRAALAHALAPSLLSLEEVSPGVVDLVWRTPLETAPGGSPYPVLPADCAALEEPAIAHEESSRSERMRLRCAAPTLAGVRLSVAGLESAGTNVLLRVALADGRRLQALLSAREPEYEVPLRSQPVAVAARFLVLGAEHLASGADHVLFVTGLVCLLRRGRPLLAALTAFTLGHSVTLALAVLGVVRLPAAAVEVGIAASLVLLACELVRARDDTAVGRLARRPWQTAFAFGLLHGLGFAAALREAGLPPGEVPLALVGFNLGLELAQLGLVALLWAGVQFLRPLPVRWRVWAPALAAEAIGILGAFFCLERMVGLIGP